jgi:hypothetical protein
MGYFMAIDDKTRPYRNRMANVNGAADGGVPSCLSDAPVAFVGIGIG